ncbi:MAG: response regulator [Bryobacteraceae bacterium]
MKAHDKITAEPEAEIVLPAAIGQLEELAQELGRERAERKRMERIGLLAGAVAHDFNNLLTGMMGNAGLALDSLPPGDPRRLLLQDVIRAGEKAANLTGQLLAYSGPSRCQTSPMEQRESCRGTGTVLFADDEEVVRRTAQAALQRYGFTILLAADGQEAVEMFRENAANIDLVVLDVTMPVMSGEEALAQIHAVKPRVRIAVSSGYNESEVLRRFVRRRVSGFLQKPYTASRLAEKIKEFMATAEAE